MNKYIEKFNNLSLIKKIGLIFGIGFVEMVFMGLLFAATTPATTPTNPTEINALQNIEDVSTTEAPADNTVEETVPTENIVDSVDNSAEQIYTPVYEEPVYEEPIYEEPIYTAPVQTEQIVYVGSTGTKYHRQHCRTLKNGSYEMTLSDAQSEGREPCKVCNP